MTKPQDEGDRPDTENPDLASLSDPEQPTDAGRLGGAGGPGAEQRPNRSGQV